MSKCFLVIVTGLSGAGRSVALKALEDIGFYCMDNLPLGMIPAAMDFIRHADSTELFAISPDMRNATSLDTLEKLKKDFSDVADFELIYLTADENTIIRRYSTTRRKHPLLDTSGQLIAAIRRENEHLHALTQLADITFDTSHWSPHFLARQLEERLKGRTPGRHLHVTLTSFGFKYGMLRPCDSLIDVRFLKNPFFELSLRELTGLEPSVQDYVKSDQDYSEFYSRLLSYLQFVLPRYYGEGKNYFRLGIGCTGGKHRSVTVTEQLSHELSLSLDDNILLSVHHRDLPVSK